MKDDIIVFLGPTLSQSEAENILPARYLPPAQQGDILSVAAQFRPKVIVLIDGLFSQTLSVWHKEILFALSQGIAVMGASSMGALRAAEMDHYGMIGVGKVFEYYKSGKVIHDDEVALIHGPKEQGYITLSVPLINIRFTIEKLVTQNKMSHEKGEQILLELQALYFPERSFENLDPLIRENYVDQKKLDAIQLLKSVKTIDLPRHTFQSTLLFDALYNYDRRLLMEEIDLPIRQIAHHAALHHEQFDEIQQKALTEALISEMTIEVTESDLDLKRKEFLTRHAITDENRWLVQNDLSLEEFREILVRKAKLEKLHKTYFDSGVVPWKRIKYFLEELKWNNTYEEWKEKAQTHETLFKEAAPHFNEIDHADISHLLDPEWARTQGFENRYQLSVELYKSQIVRDYLTSLMTSTD